MTPPLEYRPLEVPTPVPDEPYTSAPYSSGSYYRVGIPLIVFGIIALLAAAAISSGVSSYNQTCAQIPNCVPESDPSGGVAAIGVILLLVGIVVVGYAATRPNY